MICPFSLSLTLNTSNCLQPASSKINVCVCVCVCVCGVCGVCVCVCVCCMCVCVCVYACMCTCMCLYREGGVNADDNFFYINIVCFDVSCYRS